MRHTHPINIKIACQQDKPGILDENNNPVTVYFGHITGSVDPKTFISTIDELFVDEKERRHGIGKQLIESFIALAKVHCPNVKSVMVSSLPEAKPFYMKLGFKVTTLGMKVIQMRKPIK